MTATALTGPGRVVQLLWGANQQNTLTLGYPTLADNARFWRAPRRGAETAQVASVKDSWRQALDYWAAVTLRWVPDWQYAGPAGVQAFLDWASAGNAFTFVPDAASAPFFALPGCLLQQPFDSMEPQSEANGFQAIELVFRNPTYDLGLAWRGLAFEYAPGADLVAPSGGAATFARSGAVGPFVGVTGRGGTAAANVLRDRHYVGSPGLALPGWGPRVTLLEAPGTNLIENSDGEADIVGWSAVNLATLLRDNAQAFNGSWSCKVTAGASTSSGPQWTLRSGARIAATAGTVYTVSAWVYAPAASVGKTLAFNIQWWNVTPALISSPNSAAFPLVAGWQRFTWTQTAPAGTVTTVPGLLFDTNQSGAVVWMDVPQFEASAFATSAIPTGTGALTRNADDLSFPWAFSPQAGWFYVKLIESGMAQTLGYPTLLAIGNSGGIPSIKFFGEKSNGQATYGFLFWNTVNNEANPVTGPSIGDTVELLGVVNKDGSTQVRLSINGGAEIVNANAGVQAFPPAWTAATLSLNTTGGATGHAGIVAVKAGPGGRVTTLAQARAA